MSELARPARRDLWRRVGGTIAGATPAAVVLRQAVVTVVTAASVSGAGLLSAQATDEWHRALQDEVRWSALVQNDVHYVYLDEGPLAWQVEISDALAAHVEAKTQAPGLAGQLARVDADARSAAVFRLREAHAKSGTLLATDEYRLPGGGQDLPRRLADVRKATGVSAPGVLSQGDDRFLVATLLAVIPIPLVALHLLLLVVTRRRRRMFLPQSTPGELVVRPRAHVAIARRAAGVVPLVAWAAVTTLPAAQLHQAKLEARAQVTTSIQAVHIATATACSSMRTTFATQSLQVLSVQHAISLGGQLAALDLPDEQVGAAVLQLAAAQEPAWSQLERTWQAMSRAPEEADGVDPATVRVVTATTEDLERLTAEQRRSADLADLERLRSALLSLAIFLAALVGVLRRPGPGSPLHLVKLLLMSSSAAVAAWALAI